MQTFEGKQEDPIVSPFTHRQPMQAPEDTLVLRRVVTSLAAVF